MTKSKKKTESDQTPDSWKLIEIFVAEIMASGILQFFGCMSQITWHEDSPAQHWQGVVVFTCAIVLNLKLFLHISGAHITPAVTVCVLILRHISLKTAAVYVVAHFIGANLGFGLLKFITPCDILDLSKKFAGENLCSTFPHASLSDLQAVTVEFIAAFGLILLLCGILDPRSAEFKPALPLFFAPFVFTVGFTLGPLTGASINPARSFAPALWNGAWDKQWIYFVGPIAGSIAGTLFYQNILNRQAQAPLPEDLQESVPLQVVVGKTEKIEMTE